MRIRSIVLTLAVWAVAVALRAADNPWWQVRRQALSSAEMPSIDSRSVTAKADRIVDIANMKDGKTVGTGQTKSH